MLDLGLLFLKVLNRKGPVTLVLIGLGMGSVASFHFGLVGV